MAGQHTGTPQDPIPMYLYKKVGDKIYRCGGGGGSGSGDIQYVQTPTILEPTDNGSASVLLKVVVTAYSNVFDNDAWADRCFQISKQIDFAADPSITKEYHELTNTLTLSADDRLEANTVYYLRVRDTSQSGLISEWSPVITFTTGDAITVLPPTITALGYNNSTTDFVSGLTLQCSAFTVDQEQTDEHVSTSWWIDVVDSHARSSHVWESLKDTVNKLSIVVPEGTLSPNTNYRITCQHHGAEYGDGALGTKEIRTSSDFGTVNVPTLSVEGAPNDVYETPTLTAGTFSNTRDEDTHELTDWEILPQAGGAAVWQSLNDATNKTTIKVPKGKLAVSTAYTARVRYKGLRYGWSDWQSVQFNTVAAFSSINTPTLTVGGAPNSVLETPTLTLSAFGGDNATHKNTHFKVLKNDDNSEVWSTSVAAPAVSARVPAKTLQTATTYKFQGWYESVEGVTSAVAEVVATTKQTFVETGDIGRPDSPTFGVGIPSDEVAESFVPGIQKHPDFYDETKPGYGTWVVPETLIKNTTKWDGAFKFIPKFYWMPLFNGDGGEDNLKTNEELQAILPYVDVTLEQMNEVKYKYPYSGIVIARAGAFKNEADANAHGFILPAAFIDGGKEKDGFFISTTLTTYNKQAADGLNYVKIHLGETYSGRESENSFWLLSGAQSGIPSNDTDGDLDLDNSMMDAIIVAKACNNNLNCESFFTTAALGLFSLAANFYTKSTEEVAWWDKTGEASFPKGINQPATCSDDPSVTLSTPMSYAKGSIFPSTEEGFKKTTHNGKINGVTHLHGWLRRPQTSFFGHSDGSGYRMLDPSRTSILSINKSNVQDPSVYLVEKVIPKEGYWVSESYQKTPFFVEKTGNPRLYNCIWPTVSGVGKGSKTFGYDKVNVGNTYLSCAGGSYDEPESEREPSVSGIFCRRAHLHTGDWIENWHSNDNCAGFHVIGYPLKNSDGTTGNEAFLISDDTSPFHGISVLLNPQDVPPYSEAGGVHTFNVDISVSFPSQSVMDETTVSVHAYYYSIDNDSTSQLQAFENGVVSSVDEAVFTRRYTASQTVNLSFSTDSGTVEGVYIKLTRNGVSKRVTIYEANTEAYIHSWAELTSAPNGEKQMSWGGRPHH